MLLLPTVSWVVTFPYVAESQSIKMVWVCLWLDLVPDVLVGYEWEPKSPIIICRNLLCCRWVPSFVSESPSVVEFSGTLCP